MISGHAKVGLLPSSVARHGPSICARRACDRRCVPARGSVSLVAGAKVKGPKSTWVCSECGAETLRWVGLCPSCAKHGTMQEEQRYDTSKGAPGAGGVGIDAFRSAAREASRLIARGQEQVQRNGAYPGEDYDGAASGPPSTSGRSVGWVSSNASRGIAPVSLTELALRGSRGVTTRRMVLTGRTGSEINRVLGGGVVCGSLVLVGGEPGVGKSTLSLQIAAMLASPDLDYDAVVPSDDEDEVPAPGSGSPELADASTAVAPRSTTPTAKQRRSVSRAAKAAAARSDGSPSPWPRSSLDDAELNLLSPEEMEPRMVLYVSGEETCEQVYDRACRMGLGGCETLHLLPSCSMDDILAHVIAMRPAAVVVDSLQTMYLDSLPNVPGAVVQLKECCNSLLRLAKDYGITVFAIGHVTRNSDIAGPKALEHMVDAVVRLEGDMSQSYRVLRTAKNRFGTTDEVGVFSMDQGGLHAVEDPSALFLANRSSGSSAVAVVLDGTRVLVLEVQALVTSLFPGATSPPVRAAAGANRDRLSVVLVNVLHKYVAKMSNQNVVVSVTGGMQIREPAADLAIALAIVSSYYGVDVPRDVAAIGEVDLGGGLRAVRALDLRLVELAKLGLTCVVIPQGKDVAKLQRDPRLQGLTLLPCATLLEALRAVLGAQVGAAKTAYRNSSQDTAAGAIGQGRGGGRRAQGRQLQGGRGRARAASDVEEREESYDDGLSDEDDEDTWH